MKTQTPGDGDNVRAKSKNANKRAPPKAKTSSNLIDQALAYKRQASLAPEKDHGTIYAVKIIAKHKML